MSGNGKIKGTTFPFFAFHPNFSFVFVDKFLAKNQPQTGSGFLDCSLRAEILVDTEQPLDGLFWNAYPVIPDCYCEIVLTDFCRYRNLATLLGKF